ncbi:MAG: RNA methyltransferase [Pseudomonadota bacterium]
MSTRGYFGIGAEGISKPMNFSNMARTAYGFGASFVFTVSPSRRMQAQIDEGDAKGTGGATGADTGASYDHMPWYNWESHETLALPRGCRLVGVELTEDAIELPSFRHPTRAAYVLGPENGSLSDGMTAACDFVVKIPTRFCLNVATAGAIIMYDRQICLGRHAERPVRAGGPTQGPEGPLPAHVHGQPKWIAGQRVAGPKGRDRTTKVGTRGS